MQKASGCSGNFRKIMRIAISAIAKVKPPPVAIIRFRSGGVAFFAQDVSSEYSAFEMLAPQPSREAEPPAPYV